MTLRCLLAAALLGFCAGPAAQMRVEMIELNHRTVDELIPILQPLLADGGTLTGMNNQLIVKSTDFNIAEIRQVTESLDRRLRSLMIHVRRNSGSQSNDAGAALSGRWSDGDVAVEQGAPRQPRDGVSVTAGDRDGNRARLDAHDRSRSGTDVGDFRVQTLEGQPAFIQIGQQVPIPQRAVTVSPYGAVRHDSVQYYDASSGFYVIPRVSGDQVQLLVSPYMTRAQGGPLPSFDVQNIETTVIGRLGQWIPLGGVTQSSTRTENGVLYTDRTQHSMQSDFMVLVEELP
jgi:type II secretory pathway component GspD/PulD (secretin)